MSSFIWLMCLLVTHCVAYFMGRADGENVQPSEYTWMQIKQYEIDKRFEHMRWLAERKDGHDQTL